MVHSVSNITWQMRPFIKKSKSTKYTTFIWTMFIQCLETDILLTSLPFHANQDSNSKAPDVIVTTTSTASWGKWNKLRAVSLFLQIQWGECTLARAAKPRDARNEGGSPRGKKSNSLFSCLSCLAPSTTREVIYASRAFCSMDQEKRETARSIT